MKRWLWLALLLLSCAMHAQVVGPGFINYVTSAPSGTCSQGEQMRVVIGLGTVYTCQNGTWTQVGAGAGTVSSVSFTGGLISVATPTTTPAFTVAGTSGGIPFFSSTSTWASSALLAAGGLVLGGGAGAAPTTSANFTTSGAQLILAAGTNAAPTIGLSGFPSYGYGINSSGVSFFSFNGSYSLSSTTSLLRLPSGVPLGWASTSDPVGGTTDTTLCRQAGGILEIGSGTSCATSGTLLLAFLKGSGYMSVGTKFTTDTGCGTVTSLTGGATAGSFVANATGACTVVITMGDTATAPNGWICAPSDRTTGNLFRQSASTTTTCTVTGTAVSGDVISFAAIGY